MRYWDDGFGPLWVYCESRGPRGIVRAPSFEEALSCVVDEIMDDADPQDPDTWARSYDPTAAEGDLAEERHFRGSVPANEGLESAIAREDPNGSVLERLDAFLAARPDFRRHFDLEAIRAAFPDDDPEHPIEPQLRFEEV